MLVGQEIVPERMLRALSFGNRHAWRKQQRLLLNSHTKGKDIVEIWESEVQRHCRAIFDGRIEEEGYWIINTGKSKT